MTKNTSGTMIEVIGVGGAGCNAIDHMIREGVMGVEFIAIDADHFTPRSNGARNPP